MGLKGLLLPQATRTILTIKAMIEVAAPKDTVARQPVEWKHLNSCKVNFECSDFAIWKDRSFVARLCSERERVLPSMLSASSVPMLGGLCKGRYSAL